MWLPDTWPTASRAQAQTTRGTRGTAEVAMMRHTPRTFIGSVVFLLEDPLSAETAELVRAHMRRIPGVNRCDHDIVSGALVVTADVPTDRNDIIEVLDRLGCRVRDL